MTPAPKVSVCTPTYNGARYVARAIESVLEQDFDDYELVVCDDGSTDATPDLVRSYDDPRIRYRRFEERAGQSGNFNRCLSAARGAYFTMLHDDDFLLPGFLRRRVDRLTTADEAGFAFGAVRLVDREARTLRIESPWPDARSFAAGELVEALLGGAVFNLASLMVKTDVLRAVGGFRTDLTWGHDWDWTLRLAAIAAAAYDPEPLVAYRVHDGSGTAAVLRAATNGSQERVILEDALGRADFDAVRAKRVRRASFRALAHRHMYFAEQALLAGRRTTAVDNLRYALSANPALVGRPTWWALGIGSIGGKALYFGYRRVRARLGREAV
jgi:glycosyltransferase involved in cell wall biosynthesis